VDDTNRGKWIAVLVLIVAGVLFGRSMASQMADQERADAIGMKASETISTGGLYALHTQCAQQCRERGDASGAKWHEQILARMRGDAVDDSVNLDDAGEVSPEFPLPPKSRTDALRDPTHVPGVNARVDTGELLSH